MKRVMFVAVMFIFVFILFTSCSNVSTNVSVNNEVNNQVRNDGNQVTENNENSVVSTPESIPEQTERKLVQS